MFNWHPFQRTAERPSLLVPKWAGTFHGVFDSYIRVDRFGGGWTFSGFVTRRGPGNTAPFRGPGRKNLDSRVPEQRAPRIIDSSGVQYAKRTRGVNVKPRSQSAPPLSGENVGARSRGQGAARPALR